MDKLSWLGFIDPCGFDVPEGLSCPQCTFRSIHGHPIDATADDLHYPRAPCGESWLLVQHLTSAQACATLSNNLPNRSVTFHHRAPAFGGFRNTYATTAAPETFRESSGT